jgi:hypothetical protein
MAVVVVTTTPTLLAAAKPVRQRGWILIEVPKGSEKRVFVGGSDVTPETGFDLRAGHFDPCTMFIENDPLSSPATRAWYAVVEEGTQPVKVQEGLTA